MGLKTNKPRGRNGGRKPKLDQDQRLALGAYAYRLRRGAPFPSPQLPSLDTAKDDGWPISKAAEAIIDVRAIMFIDRDDGTLSTGMVRKARDVVAAQAPKIRLSDFRERQLRRTLESRPGVNAVRPASRHWCAQSVEWAEKYFDMSIGSDLVREAEREYREMIEQLVEDTSE